MTSFVDFQKRRKEQRNRHLGEIKNVSFLLLCSPFPPHLIQLPNWLRIKCTKNRKKYGKPSVRMQYKTTVGRESEQLDIKIERKKQNKKRNQKSVAEKKTLPLVIFIPRSLSRYLLNPLTLSLYNLPLTILRASLSLSPPWYILLVHVLLNLSICWVHRWERIWNGFSFSFLVEHCRSKILIAGLVLLSWLIFRV